MAELEEVDLTKALSKLATRLPWFARDIFIGSDTREQDTEIAELFEQAARLLRDRAATRPPRQIEAFPAAARSSGEEPGS